MRLTVRPLGDLLPAFDVTERAVAAVEPTGGVAVSGPRRATASGACAGRRERPRRDRGSATIWVLACCALLLVVGRSSALRTAAVLARHRAEGAADLAALAAAGRIGVGGDVLRRGRAGSPRANGGAAHRRAGSTWRRRAAAGRSR